MAALGFPALALARVMVAPCLVTPGAVALALVGLTAFGLVAVGDCGWRSARAGASGAVYWGTSGVLRSSPLAWANTADPLHSAAAARAETRKRLLMVDSR